MRAGRAPCERRAQEEGRARVVREGAQRWKLSTFLRSCSGWLMAEWFSLRSGHPVPVSIEEFLTKKPIAAGWLMAFRVTAERWWTTSQREAGGEKGGPVRAEARTALRRAPGWGGGERAAWRAGGEVPLRAAWLLRET